MTGVGGKGGRRPIFTPNSGYSHGDSKSAIHYRIQWEWRWKKPRNNLRLNFLLDGYQVDAGFVNLAKAPPLRDGLQDRLDLLHDCA